MASRVLAALALVLSEETGYKQPVGGPYTRLVVTPAWNARRRRRGLGEFMLGRYVLDYSTRKLRHEGGSMVAIPSEPDGMAFDDHPKDTGGRTGMGILQREYDAWCDLRGLPRGDVWAIPDDELTAIYQTQYWEACRCGNLEPGVDAFTFNTAVNAGVSVAIRQLQTVAGVRVDGHMGLATISAAIALPARETVQRLANMQARRYPTLRNFATFGDNWISRNKRVAIACAAWADDIAPDHPAVVAAIEQHAPRVAPEARDEGQAGRTARALYEPPATMLESKEGNVALAQGTAGGGLTAADVASAFAAASQSPQGVTLTGVLYALAASPVFWAGMFFMGSAAYFWLKRNWRREQFGI